MIRLWSMRAESAVGQLKFLRQVLNTSALASGTCNSYGTGTNDLVVNIGDVSAKLRPPKNPELVPVNYLPSPIPQSTLQHLRWMMQKDLLRQDIFLIGPPGPLRRKLAMQYLELMKKEVEYIALSRDTTENDLKQRREIQQGTAYHIDQCAVKAAIHGRVLVLEGIEKAERNVLPVLNNLLENREMLLDDGRFLIAADRYEKLLKEHSQSELDAWKLVKVDENFRVIALGLPIPRYRGNPLDPPLRSRFQARDVSAPLFKELLDHLYQCAPQAPSDKVSQMLSFAYTLLSQESSSLGLPDFPIMNLEKIIGIMNNVPHVDPHSLLLRLYPYKLFLPKDGHASVEDTFKNFELLPSTSSESHGKVKVVESEKNTAVVRITGDGKESTVKAVQIFTNLKLRMITAKSFAKFVITDKGNISSEYLVVACRMFFKCRTTNIALLKVPRGTRQQQSDQSVEKFIHTDYHDSLLTELLQSHMVHDICLIGGKGSGKSVLANQFARLLNYQVEPIMLYQDMTARDLLQQRTTLPNGDTTWTPSSLVMAALDGSLAILDGIHRINAGTLAILQRLVHDRELTLPDGTRLFRHDRYEAIKTENSFSDADLAERQVYSVHPSFRIMGLAEPPVVGSGSGQQKWLNAETLTMFLYHHMRPLDMYEETHILESMVAGSTNLLQPLLRLVHDLRKSTDPTVISLSSSLSTRQLIRIAQRLSKYPYESLYEAINKACLARFLPTMAKQTLDQNMAEANITPVVKSSDETDLEKSVTCEVKHGILRIGQTEVPVHQPDSQVMVPDILFYENAQHLRVMEDMLKDFMLGEHLLLVGNQGVGKNKIADRFLQLLNRPREYLQLHRDTTVQTLTLQPTVKEGLIVYEDSPLVRAVKLGHVLVVDEADKAPTHVTCILKSLVESGGMILADGRRIVSPSDADAFAGRANVIVMHPDFRMIVLANRPGFPFLGNDFFGALGDIYSCHAVDNPDIASEVEMLKQYGPDVPDDILQKLVLAFGELRSMADQGLISYPYSTREVVNIIRHLQKFPDEGLVSVVRNVFDFDQYNQEVKESVINTMHKHGIPIGAKTQDVTLAAELPLPAPKIVSIWNMTSQPGANLCPVEIREVTVKKPLPVESRMYKLDRVDARSTKFSEQQSYWNISMHETNIVCDVAVTIGEEADLIHIATCNPVSLHTIFMDKQNVMYVDLFDVFPTTMGAYKPMIKILPLGGALSGCVVVHEERANLTFFINPAAATVSPFKLTSFLETVAEKVSWRFQQEDRHKVAPEFCHENTFIHYQINSDVLNAVCLNTGTSAAVTVPFSIANVKMAAVDKWLVTSVDNRQYVLTASKTDAGLIATCKIEALSIQDVSGSGHSDVEVLFSEELDNNQLSKVLHQKITAPNRTFTTLSSYANVAIGFPEISSDIEIHSFPSVKWDDDAMDLAMRPGDPRTVADINRMKSTAFLPKSAQVVRAVPAWKVPKDVFPPGSSSVVSDYLEVADLGHHKLRYIPVPQPATKSPYSGWLAEITDSNIILAKRRDDGLVTVDAGGCVRLWETGLANLERSIVEWRRLLDKSDERHLQVTIERDSGKAPTAPKHGKIDPLNMPHAGGNMWAGGTGGRDTAGLGGVGGPYRLDAGHDVTQVSQAEKDAVPEEVKEAARKMAQKAFKERLKEIEMSEFDAELYEKFSSNIRRQVKALRVILDSLQAKGKERQWKKHQTSGDLDEQKLIEGLAGEKGIYKRRADQEPEPGSPQEKPKRLRLVVDVSGSMYRFNGLDGRLERSMEAALVVMEAFEKYEEKFKYDIIGHSGDGYDFEMVNMNKPPVNDKERLNVLKTMHAHSQFCYSGDHTLQAIKHAVRTINKEEADEYFVVLLSDANLDRYGIRPHKLAKALTEVDNVNAFAIFIGTLGDQAERLKKNLPAGRSFVCLDTKDIPTILQTIFTSTLLASP